MTSPGRDDKMTVIEATDWLLNQPGLVMVAPDDRGAIAVFSSVHREALARLLPSIEGGGGAYPGSADDPDGAVRALSAMLTGIAMMPSAASTDPPPDADKLYHEELAIGWLDTIALLTAMREADTPAIAAVLEGVAASPAAGRMAINLAHALLSEMSLRMGPSGIASMLADLRRRVIDGEIPDGGD